MVEWPSRYSVLSGAASNAPALSACTGMACVGIVPAGLLKANVQNRRAISPALCLCIGTGLRDFPSWRWGEARTAASGVRALHRDMVSRLPIKRRAAAHQRAAGAI